VKRFVTALAAIALAAGLAVAVADDASFPAGGETASHGAVAATLTWEAGPGSPRNPRLQITRGEAVAFDQAVGDVVCGSCVLSDERDADLDVADLDGDGEPEVIVEGATHDLDCCVVLGIYDFRAATGTYGQLVRRLPVPIKALGLYLTVADLDHDGRPEIVGGDLRFAGRFGRLTANWYPTLVLRYSRPGGVPRLTDVTRRFPAQIARDASLAKASIPRADAVALGLDERGILAAYVADEYLLGHGSTGLRELDGQMAHHKLGSAAAARAYRARLLGLLHVLGYR
jgi:hypothetical protein